MKTWLLGPSSLARLFLCVVLCFLEGCSANIEPEVTVPAGPTGSVHGKLSVDGKPAPEGTTIFFTSLKGGGVASGVVGSGGTYSASNVAAGEVSVMINGPSMKADGSLLPAGGGIPEKYGSPSTSGAKLDVKADGDVEFNLDMKN